MKKIIILAAVASFLPASLMAQVRSYSCDGGAVVTKTSNKLTTEEWAIIQGLDIRDRVDYGHYIFVRPDGTATWSRTSTIRSVCRQQRACVSPGGGSAVGLVTAPLVRLNADGAYEPCEMPREIAITNCLPDGTLSYDVITSGDTATLDAFGLGDPPSNAHNIYRDPDGAVRWSVLSAAEAAVICAPEEDDDEEPVASGSILLNDGLWILEPNPIQAQDCPPQALARGEAMGMGMMERERQVVWGNPPHPNDMMPPETSQGNPWSGSGGSWSVRAVDMEEGPIAVALDFYFQVQDPDYVQITGKMQFVMDPSMARLAGFNGNCRAEAVIDARRQIDN